MTLSKDRTIPGVQARVVPDGGPVLGSVADADDERLAQKCLAWL